VSHIYEVLKKLDRQISSKWIGWGSVGKGNLKSGSPRPRKKFLSYRIHVLLTFFITVAITYGVTLKSDLLWESPSPAPGISPGPGPQVAEIPPKVAEAAKTLPPAPDAQFAKIPPNMTETTKILPPAPAKSPAPIQKIAPLSPEVGSLKKSPPSNPPRNGVPDRKSTSPPLVSGSSPKVPPFPPFQPLALQEEGYEGPPQTTQPEARMHISPQMREEIERSRERRREYLRWMSERSNINPKFERKTPIPPATGGSLSPGIIPRVPEFPPGASPQVAAQSPKTSDRGLPRLKISAIVWHEQPAMRRAVINGSFATEGYQIEGVKVVKIFPTRVRFSYKNQVFELSAFD